MNANALRQQQHRPVAGRAPQAAPVPAARRPHRSVAVAAANDGFRREVPDYSQPRPAPDFQPNGSPVEYRPNGRPADYPPPPSRTADFRRPVAPYGAPEPHNLYQKSFINTNTPLASIFGAPPPPAPGPRIMDNHAFKATGKTVVITGASQGIGRATALVFARKGFNVVVAARDPTKLQYVADDCCQAAARQQAAIAVPTDVTNEAAVRNLANVALARFETVDAVINCAGMAARGLFEDTPLAEAQRLMNVNFFGAWAVSQAFLPMLKQTAKLRPGERPSLVLVNSFAGKVPLKYMTAYTASKHALHGFAQALRTEVEGSGIHLAEVHPGMTKSNVMEHTEFYGRHSEEDRRSFRQALRTPLLAQSPGEVADAIYNAVMSKQNEAQVGLPYAIAAGAYSVTGVNVSALPFL